MSDIRMLPEPVVRMTQFYRAKDEDTQFFGSCGQTALAVCMACAAGNPSTFEGVGELMIHITQSMIASGIASPNGAARLTAYAQQARTMGAKIRSEIPYHEPLFDWQELLKEQAGIRPILLQVAHGGKLTDSETGRHDDEALRYHAFAVVGVRDDGYICADSAHPEITRRFQIYSLETLVNALPCGMLILEMQRDSIYSAND